MDGTDRAESAGPMMQVIPGQTAWRQTGQESVVLDLVHSRYLSLNGSASRLWKLLVAGATRDQLTECMLDTAADAPGAAQVDTDVAEFLSLLMAQGLVRVTPS